MDGKFQKIPPEGLFNENVGFTSGDQLERLIDRNSDDFGFDRLPPPHANWIPAKRVVKGDDFFAIDAETPTEKISMRFFPENPESGTYSITPRPAGRNRTDHGKTIKVIDLTDEKIKAIVESRHHSNLRLQEIVDYEKRFLVHTLTGQRPYKKLAWIIGLGKKPAPESTPT
jgi:hypothetical protein